MRRLLAWWRRRRLVRPCRFCGGTDGVVGCYACWGRTGTIVLPTVHLTTEQVPPSAFSSWRLDGGTLDLYIEGNPAASEADVRAFAESFEE